MNEQSEDNFYSQIEPFSDFTRVTEPDLYRFLPDDWIIGVADVVDSTGAIKAGLYKTINTIGASIIAAQFNIPGKQPFPYVFGGDGAAFAIWSSRKEAAAEALMAVKRWAHEEFDMALRVALVPVGDIRAQGMDVAVARFQVSDGVDYAMFKGGGVVWAEQKMKDGAYQLEMAAEGIVPDLSGLSCRWTPLVPKRGMVLSVLASPRPDAPFSAYSATIHELLELVHRLERDGHPVPIEGPTTSWQPKGVTLEAHASRGIQKYWRRLLELRVRIFIAWLFFLTNTSTGEINPDKYRAEVSSNTDFRKFDDGLKLTLDCDEQMALMIEELLEKARKDKILHYGTFRQKEAMMTCIVPSTATNDHMHFVDGASGGYAQASIMLKKSLAN